MPGTVSISRADIKSREKEWFGGSRDQFSASLQPVSYTHLTLPTMFEV